jgi:hypothetical protein
MSLTGRVMFTGVVSGNNVFPLESLSQAGIMLIRCSLAMDFRLTES